MKKTLFLSFMLCVVMQGCSAQEQNKSNIDFFNIMDNVEGVWVDDYYLNSDNTLSIPYIYYEFAIAGGEKGDGCFFAIPKKEYKIWKVENRTNWKQKDIIKNRREKLNMSNTLLFHQKDILLDHFDIYVFYVAQEGMMQEGTYMSDDGKLILDYHPKDDAIIYTYKYENSIWVELKHENLNHTSTKGFGVKIMEAKLKKRFGKF
jgi:hypothetical protein